MASNSVERGRSLNAAMGRSSPGRRRSASTCSAERGAWASTTSSRTASRWIGAATPRFRSIIVDGNGTVKPDGLNYLPVDGLFEVPEGNALGLEPGFYTRVPGATGQTSADYRPFVRSTDGFNPAPFNYSQTPNERAALWLLGSRPLGESTNLFLEAFVHHRESAQQAAPEFFVRLRRSDAGGRVTGIPADNYYNPFGVDVPFSIAAWSRPATAGPSRRSICGAR